MKIAITGHTKGLGAELVKLLEPDHEIVGFSRSNGYDIEQPGVIDKIVENVKDCDMFINNAKCFWHQTDMFSTLLLDWAHKKKRIVNIGSHVTVWNYNTDRPNFPKISANHYVGVKAALKAASYHAWENYEWPLVHLVQPGPFVNTGFKPYPDRTWMETEQLAKAIVDNVINSELLVMELTVRSYPKEPKETA
jgi:nucleoside-diphosphate-sugar epimerase